MKHPILLLLTIFLLSKLTAQQNPAVLAYIQQYKQLAVDEMLRTGVPASIKLAQGIHETEAGRSDLVLRSNNHFGIKCKTSWTGAKVYHDDDAAGECFRSYGEAAQSYRDHSDFLRTNQRYSFLFKLDPTDYEAWAYGLKKAGYATNIKYSQLLIRLIESYNLQDYTLVALGKKAPSSDLLVGIRPPAESEIIISGPPVIANYPTGVFEINDTKVVYTKAGSSLLAVADEHRISLSRLLDFNDITPGEGDLLMDDQLIFLQRKRKTGAGLFHIVSADENLYDIAQAEGIRYGSLLELNQLQPGMEPAEGERLYLKEKSPRQPLLAGAKRPLTKTETVYTPAPEESFVQQASLSTKAIKHIVRDKETLFGISKKYGVSIEQLKDWNRLSGSGLRKGQQLLIYRN
jgi:LysM repeat protein